jgi:uncharacterized protein with HEPN domain
MRPDPKKYLHDMREACLRVRDFTDPRTLAEYREDSLLRSAVERQFQILGEALAQLSRRYPDVAERIPDHRGIINFRNVLVHGYDAVEDEVVWGLAEGKVPPLIEVLETLLAEPQGSD